MGTDIHLYVEKKSADRTWEAVEPPYTSSWGDHKTWSPWAESGKFDDPRPDPTNRSYKLFSFLAGVRNGFGFAGVYTGEPIVPQFPDRGIPDDTSMVKDEEGYCQIGDHSYTHATLKELLDAPWDVWFYSGGLVTVEGFLNRNEQGIPPSWCGGVSGDQSNIIDSPEEFQKLIDSGKDMTGYYCRVGWKWQPLMNCGFRVWCLETLKPMVEDPEDLRVLIGFDS